ncbi:MAG: hypothetical protein WCK64_07260 [Synechococcaceae cyanobacterium ELA445]
MLYANRIHRYTIWNYYAALAIFLAIFERMLGSNKSWSLFATPWGFIMDAMGMQMTFLSGFPLITFLIFLAIFAVTLSTFSAAMAKAYVIELIGAKRLSTKAEDGWVYLTDPKILDYAKCLLYILALTAPVAIIHSL